MLIVTTPFLDGHKITEYKGCIFHSIVTGFDLGLGISAWFKNIAGGRSEMHESHIEASRNEALREFIEKVRQTGANAAVGVSMEYEMISGTQSSNGLLMVKVSGTAVIAQKVH